MRRWTISNRPKTSECNHRAQLLCLHNLTITIVYCFSPSTWEYMQTLSPGSLHIFSGLQLRKIRPSVLYLESCTRREAWHLKKQLKLFLSIN
ncbi:hypothetical protein METBIDRAFT_96742 [Metschnikowia bicuspidata var. bicuspidata NRRL YB-4993]|uniref:Uncharacterized protein n=1 Tax=Metschnikowia bicuspidata var. bicuspidata NRRL YB-4993 TaxID=869754 RepID=A0A1A0HGM1_9ASCO|nr:hypothetical protein METBIDRAFT_96742 [Metschnikowia bicuspidata var. bicuspidata NRRL YB-4993]OBA23027.1 hypothetical protein METBIDRAFT_96742 [Metschnikowia bicuspidata var. bicuspidata NRRL YB-4993]